MGKPPPLRFILSILPSTARDLDADVYTQISEVEQMENERKGWNPRFGKSNAHIEAVAL